MMAFITEHMDIIAQALGFMAMGTAILTYQFKAHKTVMFLLMTASVFWCLHFIALGKYTGCALNVLNIFRCLVYSFKDSKKWAGHKSIPWLFGAISVLICLFTWEGPASILPLIGTGFSTYANWQSNTKRLKIFTLPVSLTWGIYDVLSKSIAGTCNEILVVCSIFIYFIRSRNKPQASK